MSKFFCYLLALSFVLSFSLVSVGQHSKLPYYDSTWSKPYKPFRIAGNLYYVGTYDLACYLLVTPKGNVLINSGLAESVSMIKKNVEALGFKLKDIKILLTTQAHYDHVAGFAEIKKLTGAKMMVHEADAPVLADGGSSDFIFGGKGTMFVPVKADRLLHDGDTVKVGDKKLRVLHHPGHTKGSTSFLVDVTDDTRSWKVLIVNMPTLLSETKLTGAPSYPTVAADYEYTFQSLKRLQFDIWVASHAGQFDLHRKRKEGDVYNPGAFIDREGYDTLVNKLQLAYTVRINSGK